MSHFTVLVISKPGEDIAALLQPFHEYECTGTNDQYVQNVSVLEEAREQFKTETTLAYVRPDGTRIWAWNKEGSWNEELAPYLTQDNYGRKTLEQPPEGWRQVDAPASEFQSLGEWIADYYGLVIKKPDGLVGDPAQLMYGWVTLDAEGEVLEAVKRTNPNKRWDWWQVGGR